LWRILPHFRIYKYTQKNYIKKIQRRYSYQAIIEKPIKKIQTAIIPLGKVIQLKLILFIYKYLFGGPICHISTARQAIPRRIRRGSALLFFLCIYV
jgi:hypothetical protein